MFRFTIRDVLRLTVVVGLAMGWRIQWRACERAGLWFDRAGAMEHYLTDEGKVISYKASGVTIFDKIKGSESTISGKAYPPQSGALDAIREG